MLRLKRTDDNQTRQNTGNPPERYKTKQELRISNKQKQIQTDPDMLHEDKI